jgi:hypothetical protein
MPRIAALCSRISTGTRRASSRPVRAVEIAAGDWNFTANGSDEGVTDAFGELVSDLVETNQRYPLGAYYSLTEI